MEHFNSMFRTYFEVRGGKSKVFSKIRPIRQEI